MNSGFAPIAAIPLPPRDVHRPINIGALTVQNERALREGHKHPLGITLGIKS